MTEFDPLKASKVANSMAKLTKVNFPESQTTLSDIKKLAGISDTTTINMTYTAAEKADYMRANNIKSGTPEWFKLWFSRPYLTGESPFKE